MYQRGQTPVLVQELLSVNKWLPQKCDADSPDLHCRTVEEVIGLSRQKRFVSSFLNLEKAIKETFRSINQPLIAAVALVFGPSLTNMVEMYLIDISFCNCDPESSTSCVPLSCAVLQFVVRSMLRISVQVPLKEIGETSFFFLTKAHRTASLEKFYPKPGPHLLTLATGKRCAVVHIRLCHSACYTLANDLQKLTLKSEHITMPGAESEEERADSYSHSFDAVTAEDSDFIWFQYEDVLNGFR
ncbi:unnamed protein product [Soboliphyme baturini]|uniref:ANK_REP_REGION domain-containing protein n=1 Tax=Soboliphyme baturini TaxID=241478 RepID=A0A183IU41_9BILA|nr:unnamed protein product [Soboliphyme baturini]